MVIDMNFFPLCIKKLVPTNSGIIVDFLDQVLIGLTFPVVFFSFSIYLIKLGSTNGPFHTDLAIN